MELKAINEIKRIGIDKFVNKYNLKKKDYGHKFSLKYDQLNTPKNEFTNECRGLVLTNDFRLMSLPFIRFNNYSENTRSTIDWETATYWEKTDGTLIHYYYDFITNEWKVGTTGTAEAVENVSCRNKITNNYNQYDFSLTDLFYRTCEKLGIDLSKCSQGATYIFELATEQNIVINSYEKSTIKLLGIRDLNDGGEFSNLFLKNFAEVINCERPIQYFFESEKEMVDSLKDVKYGDINFEGYVIVDENFNRLKVKSNTYLVYSQFNGVNPTSSGWRLVDVMLNNESEEVVANFPILKEPLDRLRSNYDTLIEPVKETFERLKSKTMISPLEKREFFTEGSKSINFDKKKKPLLTIFSQLSTNNNITFDEAVEKIDRKKLYKLIS